MKNLIVYYSFTNNNEKLAEYLGERLNCDIAKIETAKKRNGLSILFDLVFNRKPGIKPIRYSLKDYQHVVFVAPIWAGKIAMPLKSFLIDEKINVKRYSFITLCGGGNPNQRQKIQDELTAIVQKKPSVVEELWVNDLLSAEKKNTIKYTSGFRVEDDGLKMFEAKIQEFIKAHELVNAV